MLASLLQDNVRDFPTRALAARMARGEVVLLASDRDLAVTVSFRPGEVVIRDGAAPGATVLAGEWLDLARLCSGQRSPIAALASRELRLTGVRGMRAAAGAGLALSVPKSFYDQNPEASRHRRLVILVSLSLVAAGTWTGVAALRVRGPRGRSRCCGHVSGRAREGRAREEEAS